MKSVCVFCGSSYGTEKVFMEKTIDLGKSLVKRNLELVYGGAKVGLMGIIADSVLKEGGEVVGVLPEFLQGKEIAHTNLTELIIVGSMHERKIKMNELSDGVIALPGGYGTLEEFFEMLTWGQLGLHQKPIGVLNIAGYFNPLIEFTHNMVEKGFLKEINKEMLLVSEDVDELLNLMESYEAPSVGKWIDKETS